MNIAYTCQENYANIAGVSIYSLLKANKNEEIHIYFLDSGLLQESRNRMEELCKTHGNAMIEFFNVEELLITYSKNLTAFQNNFATYAKLFIEILLPKNLDECLYIDADTLIIDSIKDVFANKDDYTLYMGYDVVYPKYKKSLGFTKNDAYFNAGVIFINLKKWRENKYSEKILLHLSEEKKYRYGDQDIFNRLFYKDIGEIGFQNNVITQFFYYKKLIICKFVFGLKKKVFYKHREFNLKKISVIHFTNLSFMRRPWFKYSTHPYAKEYKNFVKESPYAEVFCFQDCKQPVRRSLIQIVSKGKYNYILPIIVGILSKYI